MRFVKFIILFFLLSSVSTYAQIPEGTYIMKKESNIVYIYDGEDIECKSLFIGRKSGCPYFDANGMAYISVKHFFAAFGTGDEYKADGDSLTLRLNKKKCTVPIEKKFAVRGYEKKGYMYVYRAGDDYYIPVYLLAFLYDTDAFYDYAEGDSIIFVGSKQEYDKYCENEKVSAADFMNSFVPNIFMNNSLENAVYQDFETGLPTAASNARSAFRLGKKIYYVKDYTMYLKNGESDKKLEFYDMQNSKKDICVYKAFFANGNIYGIATGNAFGKTGRLFRCNTDGTEFSYIGTNTVKNIMFDGDKYIYYMTADKKAKLYMYNTEHRDEYEISVIDSENNSLIENMSGFAVTSGGIAAVNGAMNGITFIKFDRPAYECEWIKIRDEKNIKTLGSFEKINSVNYDNINNCLYVTDKNRLVKIDCSTFQSAVIYTSAEELSDVYLYLENSKVKYELYDVNGKKAEE